MLSLLIKMQMGLLTLVQLLVSTYAPVRAAKQNLALTRPRLARGAEFIEVALYAAIILILATIFRNQLRDAFNNLLTQIRGALGA